MREIAYAKINLALHLRRRREDGYHELETLFAFFDQGDAVSVSLAPQDSLYVSGEFGAALDNPFDNIVMKTLTKFPRSQGWAVSLEKNLPVAAGLGGGSADAGALFRLIQSAQGLPSDWQARAATLGADVPACVASAACIGRGIGTELEQIENDMAGTPVLLVNPRVPLSTGPVFKGWDGIDRGAMPSGTMREIAFAGRNDLERPALLLCPIIDTVLRFLDQTGALLVRMSGSGATCFALYQDVQDLRRAADMVQVRHGDWWQMAGKLR